MTVTAVSDVPNEKTELLSSLAEIAEQLSSPLISAAARAWRPPQSSDLRRRFRAARQALAAGLSPAGALPPGSAT